MHPRDALSTATDDARWTALLRDVARDAALWLLVVAALGAFRILLCVSFVTDARPADIAHALVVGIRFDAVIATLVVTPSSALGLAAYVLRRALPVSRVRRWTAVAFWVVAPVFYAADYGFFREFSDHFNLRLIALEGATVSLAETIWKSHPPLGLLLAAAGVSALGIVLVRGIDAMQWTPGALARRHRSAARPLVVLAGIAVYVVLLRGISIGESPVRLRNAFVTGDAVLNRAIPSPAATLLHALEDRNAARTAPSRDAVRAALHTLRPARGDALGDAIEMRAAATTQRPRHVFLIVMEGQHGFPLLPRYSDTGLAQELAKLADGGASVRDFVSAGPTTDTALAAIVSGLLVPDVVLSNDAHALAPFATSLAPHFRRLGYRTRFFYGGYLGWARLDLFLSGQGFDEVLGAPNVGTRGNAWGVWDRDLYDFVLRQVRDDVPSVNVILTTTNHSPYDLPAASRPALSPAARALAAGDAPTLAVFEHEAYADREVGRFVERARHALPRALFAITGDHPAHVARPRFPKDAKNEAIVVPMVFAGFGLPANGPLPQAGSHLDIPPTLYELCAPAGFVYRSLGTNLFAANRENVGIGSPWILGPYTMVEEDGSGARAMGVGVGSGDVDALVARQHAVRTVSRALLDGARSAPIHEKGVSARR